MQALLTETRRRSRKLVRRWRLTVPISEPAYFATGSNNRDDEKTMLSELVPTEACLNSSGAGTSLFWSSVVRYSRIL